MNGQFQDSTKEVNKLKVKEQSHDFIMCDALKSSAFCWLFLMLSNVISYNRLVTRNICNNLLNRKRSICIYCFIVQLPLFNTGKKFEYTNVKKKKTGM